MNPNNPPIESLYIACDERDSRTQQAYEMLTSSLGRIGIEQVNSLTDAQGLVVIGGDGSFIQAVHKYDFPQLPMRGINTGTIGFFMATEPTRTEIDELVGNVRTGDYTIDPLSVMELSNERGERLGRALNEVVIKSDSGQALHLNVRIGEADFGLLTGDGVILSTASGSTGYAKSAGGSFMHEAIGAYEVVPLNPYYSALDRPAIVTSQLQTRVTVLDTEKRPFQLSLDGKLLTPLNPEETEQTFLVQNAADTKVHMIRFDGYEYFKKLGHKIREIRELHS
jgi:NAD+ kinase